MGGGSGPHWPTARSSAHPATRLSQPSPKTQPNNASACPPWVRPSKGEPSLTTCPKIGDHLSVLRARPEAGGGRGFLRQARKQRGGYGGVRWRASLGPCAGWARPATSD